MHLVKIQVNITYFKGVKSFRDKICYKLENISAQ